MIHEVHTQVAHVITFADDEASALGQWLLEAYEQEGDRRADRGHKTIPMPNEVYEIVGDLANHLNGVD